MYEDDEKNHFVRKVSYKNANVECSKQIVNEFRHIKESTVQHCYDESFFENERGEQDNKLLREDRAQHYALGFYIHPILTINNYTYRGDLYGRDVFLAICSAFKNKPS